MGSDRARRRGPGRGALLGGAFVLALAGGAHAQDTHYWAIPYGPVGQLVGGQVIGGVPDLSATFYNPGALALRNESSYLLSTESVQTVARLTGLAPALHLGFAPAARSAEAWAADPVPSPKEARDDGRRTIARLPANLCRSVASVFHGDNLVPFLAGSTAAATASYFDDDVRDSFQTTTFDWGDTLETGAGPVWSTVFVAGMFTAGRFSRGPRFRSMTYDMLDAAVVNFGYTELIKVVVGRERPNGEDEKSFPSGHTSNAFALATVAERHYGWKVGLPAYLAAGLVGASRLEQDKHYLSDVVAGAVLGYIVGRTVERVNGRPLADGSPRGAAVQVAPMFSRRARGVQLSVTF